ncbi:MAG: hypothetical protein ACYDAP_10400 [Thermoplasmataceae archaeon]|jgi:hypothetical protein
MNNMVDYCLWEAYSSMKDLDKLKEFDPIINRESYGSMSKKIYRNNTDTVPSDEYCEMISI